MQVPDDHGHDQGDAAEDDALGFGVPYFNTFFLKKPL